MGQPVIARSGTSFRTELTAGKHTFVADEPGTIGGNDEGPTPYDFLSAALGSCTSMTLRVVANREKIPLEGLEITITNDRMHAKDCTDCLTTEGYVHRFDVALRLIGASLTEAHRARLLDVAKRCPVYRTLSNEIRIVESEAT